MSMRIRNHGITHTTSWTIGDPVPPINAHIVHIEASGPELDLILDAMRNTSPKGTTRGPFPEIDL